MSGSKWLEADGSSVWPVVVVSGRLMHSVPDSSGANKAGSCDEFTAAAAEVMFRRRQYSVPDRCDSRGANKAGRGGSTVYRTAVTAEVRTQVPSICHTYRFIL